jgi:hypothetical protein
MKIEKIYAILFILIFALAIMPFAFAEADVDINCEPYGFCDAFADGTIDNIDYEWILSYAVGEVDVCAMDQSGYESNLEYCDIDGDGDITAYDASLLMNYVGNSVEGDVIVSVGVDNNGPTSDVLLAETLKEELEIETPTFLFSETDATAIDEVVIIAIYYNEVVIIIPADSPVDDVMFGVSAQNKLNVMGVDNTMILANTITSSDFKDLFVVAHIAGDVDIEIDKSEEALNNQTIVSSSDLVVNDVVPPVVEVTEREIKPFYNSNGAEMRFLQLEEALVKAIEGQKEIVTYINEGDSEVDTTVLVDVTEKLAEILEKVQSVDYESNSNDLIDTFHALKIESMELIKIFREEAHKFLPEEDVNKLRIRVRNMHSEKANLIKEKRITRMNKYNSEKVNDVFAQAGINNSKLIAAVEAGEANYGEIRSAVAHKFKELDNDAKKEIAFKIREAKTRMDVQKDAVMQRIHKTNLTAIKERVRAQISAVNANRVAARQGQAAQGGNNQ